MWGWWGTTDHSYPAETLRRRQRDQTYLPRVAVGTVAIAREKRGLIT